MECDLRLLISSKSIDRNMHALKVVGSWSISNIRKSYNFHLLLIACILMPIHMRLSSYSFLNARNA